MIQHTVQIDHQQGLHARTAALFVQTAGQFRCKIEVVSGSARMDGKSILGLMALAPKRGTTLVVEADGADEQEAMNALIAVLEGEDRG